MTSRDHPYRYPVQSVENISQRQANGFGPRQIFDADHQHRPPIMPIDPEKTGATDEVVEVDDPGLRVLLDEADLGLRRLPPAVERRRVARR